MRLHGGLHGVYIILSVGNREKTSRTEADLGCKRERGKVSA